MSGAKAIDDNYRCLMEYWFPQIEKIEKELPVDIPKTDYIALLDPELFHNVIFQRATKEDYSLLVHYINVTRGEC